MIQRRQLPAAIDFPRLRLGCKSDVKCFILHITTAYPQHVFNMLKHLKCFATFHFGNLYWY